MAVTAHAKDNPSPAESAGVGRERGRIVWYMHYYNLLKINLNQTPGHWLRNATKVAGNAPAVNPGMTGGRNGLTTGGKASQKPALRPASPPGCTSLRPAAVPARMLGRSRHLSKRHCPAAAGRSTCRGDLTRGTGQPPPSQVNVSDAQVRAINARATAKPFAFDGVIPNDDASPEAILDAFSRLRQAAALPPATP